MDDHKIPALSLLSGLSTLKTIGKEAVSTHSELVGIYNVGAANSSIADALRDTGIETEIVFIGHHLTQSTKH